MDVLPVLAVGQTEAARIAGDQRVEPSANAQCIGHRADGKVVAQELVEEAGLVDCVRNRCVARPGGGGKRRRSFADARRLGILRGDLLEGLADVQIPATDLAVQLHASGQRQHGGCLLPRLGHLHATRAQILRHHRAQQRRAFELHENRRVGQGL